MIHPTRTNLLLLKEKTHSVSNSIGILKARKQALIKEFLDTARPLLRSREDIRSTYGKALRELALSLGHEGKDTIESLTVTAARDFGIDIIEKSIWGLKYKDIVTRDRPVREPEERGYDYLSTTPHLEECSYHFEKLLEAMIKNAEFENKFKRIGAEILRTTRKIRVLEELVFPEITRQVKTITQFIAERERESYFRLKRFKEMGSGKAEYP
ncbi:MAG TPA: V-type ATP synthase subunit D [Dissulfurispiraceae bacterium]|nr:V-type ATP synthase subunit D [Dissulfurispiraceae bacterium]